jgi:hypothetical protein
MEQSKCARGTSWWRPPSRARTSVFAVTRPTRFEHFRYLGDKRSQVVYDLDVTGDDEVDAAIAELLESEQFAAFGPDTLAEARNRGYHPHRSLTR